MLRKILFYIFLIMILSFNQNLIAEEPQEKIHHFIFKVEKEISVSDNEAIMDSFRIKTDELGIDRCLIKRDGKLFIVTYKTNQRPEDIVAKIQADKFPVPLTFIAYFLCDVAENKEHFLNEDFSPSPK